MRSFSLNNAGVTRWFGPLLLTVFAAGLVCAQPSPFVPVGADDRLAHATVTAIAVGPHGFLWVGTRRGLFRYDGVTVTDASENEDTLPADTVTAILTDRFGAMWVGTRRSGLLRYDAVTRRFAAVEPDAARPLREITALAADSEGRIWVGTRAAGALRYNPADGSVERYDHDPFAPASLSSPVVVDVAVGSAGRVFVAGFDRGLSVVHPDGRVEVHRSRVGTDGGLPTDELAALAVEAGGTLVVADRGGGVGRFDPDSGAYEPVAGASRSGVPVTLLEATDDGSLWVGWRDGHLVSVDGEQIEAFAPPAPVVSLARDASGVVWVGTYAGGLARYHPRTRLFERRLDAPTGGRRRLVTSLAEGPGGTVWVGVDAEGLLELDPRSGTATPVALAGSLPAAPVVLDVDADADGIDLALGSGGHARLRAVPSPALRPDGVEGAASGQSPNTTRLELVQARSTSGARIPPVTRVRRDGERLLLGTSGWGLVVSESGDDPVRYDLDGESVSAIEVAGERRFWVGTDGPALVLFSPERGVVERVEIGENAAVEDAVWSIDVHPGGALWLAAREAGLARYDPERGVTARLRPGVDFDARSVRGAVSDRRGGVWFTTTDGLFRLDERTGRLDRYSAADGTGTDEYTAGAILRASDGTIYAGGPNGVVRFDPTLVRPSEYRPPVVIAAVTVAGRPVSWSDLAPTAGVRSHDPRLLTIRRGTAFAVTAASLDFSDPGSLRYAYRLVSTGRERSRSGAWIDAGADRTIGFAGLRPGSYRLYVRGTNGDGVFNPEPAVLDVTVVNEWWRTPGAVAASVATGVLVVVVFVGWIRARRALADLDARLNPR